MAACSPTPITGDSGDEPLQMPIVAPVPTAPVEEGSLAARLRRRRQG